MIGLGYPHFFFFSSGQNSKWPEQLPRILHSDTFHANQPVQGFKLWYQIYFDPKVQEDTKMGESFKWNGNCYAARTFI